MDLYARPRTFTDGLVIDLGPEEALELHGALLACPDRGVSDRLLSILESYRAGTDMGRFEKPEEYPATSGWRSGDGEVRRG